MSVEGAELMTIPAEKREPVDYLAYLDGIRGGAAFWVLLAHCGIWGGWMFMPDPKKAVDIFMVLSGYLMSYHYLLRGDKEDVNTWATALNFWVRRFFRIAPLYYLALVGALILVPWVREGLCTLQAANATFWANNPIYDPHRVHATGTNFWVHVTFAFGLIPKYVNGVFLPDWSIGLEMQFYAAFPLLFFLFCRIGYVVTTLACVFLTIGTSQLLAMLPPFAPGVGVFPEPSFLPMKLPLFLVGMLAAESHHLFMRSALQRTISIVLSLLLASRHSFWVVATVAVIMVLGVQHEKAGRGAVWESCAFWRSWLNGLLANRVARFMADTSYAVYLLHGFAIALLGGYLYEQQGVLSLAPPMRVAILCLLVIPVSYILATVSCRLVEKPGILLGRAVIARMTRPPAQQCDTGSVTEGVSTVSRESSGAVRSDNQTALFS